MVENTSLASISRAPLLNPSMRQRQALDTKTHVWVSASAGTGKTKILTDRVLVLLLEGIAPSKILCLTFTKAAASEMLNRILEKVMFWATNPEETLKENLESLLGYPPSQDRIIRARHLFIILLESMSSLKIQTLHSFCQSLLKKFPCEAKINPAFRVLDEGEAAELKKKSFIDILTHPPAPLKPTVEALATELSWNRAETILNSLLFQGNRLRALSNSPEEERTANLLSLLDIPSLHTMGDFGPDWRLAKETIHILSNEDGEIAKRRELLKQAQNLKENTKTSYELYKKFFLTQSGTIRSHLLPRRYLQSHPDLFACLQDEGEKILTYENKQKSYKIGSLSQSLMHIACAIYQRYQYYKEEDASLDYDDLISKVIELFHDPLQRSWILYTLDAQIDHILIDEAQDTSFSQWLIIQSLCEEYFTGASARSTNRTLFAVGDDKQSIYSFQGSDPGIFLTMGDYYQEQSNLSHASLERLSLDISFRSSDAILKGVDETFKPLFPITPHYSYRQGHGGRIEVWPLTENTSAEEKTHPRQKAAEHIAERIKTWLKEKVWLPAKGRCIQAQDVMILVQRRGSYMEEMIRALKKNNIPVGGVDRLHLLEQTAIQDLLILGDFLLLPDDDFSLAALLKSPLYNFSEEAIFDLAYERRDSSLWHQLQEKSMANPQYADALQSLNKLRQQVNSVTPFALYMNILECMNGRQLFLHRLGTECLDSIEEFLTLTQKFSLQSCPSLQDFLLWIRHLNPEIKRDFSITHRDEVRVMTVHGAKGLQAPIIFLADATRTPLTQEDILWGDHCFIWSPPADLATPALQKIKSAYVKQQNAEYYRLLYVAMTRAEDHLYVVGWKSERRNLDHTWYTHIRQAVQRLNGESSEEDHEPLIYEEAHEVALSPSLKVITSDPEPSGSEVPQWIYHPVSREEPTIRPLSPSNLTLERDKTSPNPHNAPVFRGHIIHKLLEELPKHPKPIWDEYASVLLKQEGIQETNTQSSLIKMVTRVLENPCFASFFGKNSYSEVPVFGLIKGLPVSGKIDRLVVLDKEIIIIDYKSNQSPPTELHEIPVPYLQQLSIYDHLLRSLYPDHLIQCVLLWTETNQSMIIPEPLLQRHLPI